METETSDHCVKNATASQLPTTTDVVTRFTTEKNVMLASDSPIHPPSQLRLGNEQDIQKINHVKCADLVQDIHTNLMYIMWMAI